MTLKFLYNINTHFLTILLALVMVCLTNKLCGAAASPLRNGLLFDVGLGVSANDVCMIGISGCAAAAFGEVGVSMALPTE